MRRGQSPFEAAKPIRARSVNFQVRRPGSFVRARHARELTDKVVAEYERGPLPDISLVALGSFRPVSRAALLLPATFRRSQLLFRLLVSLARGHCQSDDPRGGLLAWRARGLLSAGSRAAGGHLLLPQRGGAGLGLPIAPPLPHSRKTYARAPAPEGPARLSRLHLPVRPRYASLPGAGAEPPLQRPKRPSQDRQPHSYPTRLASGQ